VGHSHFLSLLSLFTIHSFLLWIWERINMVGGSPGQPCTDSLYLITHLCCINTSDKLITQIDEMEARTIWSGARHTERRYLPERRMEENMCPLFPSHNFNYFFLMLYNTHSAQYYQIKQEH
jgi:hypothetical protein